MRYLLVLLLLIGCGGGAVDAPRVEPRPVPFGWWGAGKVGGGWAVAPGNVVTIKSGSVPETIALVREVSAAGKKPLVMVHPMAWVGQKRLAFDWREKVAHVVEEVGPLVWGYYLDDEPGFNEHTDEDLAAVAAALPAGARVFMSLSVPEVERQFIPQGVVVGVNLYHAHGDTPQTAIKHLDALAARGKRMYLNLDGMAFTTPAGCAIPEAHQRKSIELNDALLVWARKRSDVDAVIAFLWQSEANVCGAADLPILQTYLRGVAENTLKGQL